MAMIRLQNSTPSEYCAQSRDFQLFCRLYDTVFNSLQFNISTITSILDTKRCRDTILPLLQTKLGFFTNKETDNASLRYFLEVFPLLVKDKGTAKAIQRAVITFLKINKVLSPVTIYYTIEEIVLTNNYTVPDHTILIGINCSFLDTTLLEEVLKYILPAGIGYYFYFYTDIKTLDKQITRDNAVVLYTSYNINAQIRGNEPTYSRDEENRLINAVDTIMISNNDSFIPTLPYFPVLENLHITNSDWDPLTDLTDTAWKFKSSVNVTTDFSYDITFSSLYDSTNTFVCFYVDDTDIIWEDSDAHEWKVYSNNNWRFSDARTIFITGGSDATNSLLINWLLSNAYLVS